MNKEIVDAIEKLKCRALKNGIDINYYFQLKKHLSKYVDLPILNF